ncbi:NUDIX hydrolase [Shouchella lonarensis]|uniref:ADP-ribose pyrophosphatase YjhB, NUDIX family n=1 Tax=Shouchella lonarensis TaxID=1464122 RepID=A0A1G6GUL7_9BACI|nr:NUDIX hydrolase [Shouchella lonarensis]SDB85385.1 ADP-ribose pyrophosphatase YjhB, NUDIX family [Shouchella lonarensis]
MNWQRHIGVYGICHDPATKKLCVIQKKGGPYDGMYDLPGGSLESNETLEEALKREFVEETGYQIEVVRSIGTADFLVEESKRNRCVHHIALYYEVLVKEGQARELPKKVSADSQVKPNDSGGVYWLDPSEASTVPLSPLVQKALDWLASGDLGVEAGSYSM